MIFYFYFFFFFFNDTATTEIYTTTDTLSLHDALPIFQRACSRVARVRSRRLPGRDLLLVERSEEHTSELQSPVVISYAVFCLKKKKNLNKDDASFSRNKRNQESGD